MMRIGAHVSISDGFPAALDHEIELGGNCGQVFVGSPRGWAVSDRDPEEAAAFREACEANDVGPWIVHGTYLVNFATPKDDLAEKSLTTVQDEVDAAGELGIPYYTFHPGAHTGAGVEQGIQNVADRLSMIDIPSDVMILLENTAGRGTTVGKRFEHLDQMIQASSYDYSDLGVCLDSCHLFAAGYEFREPSSLEDMLEEVEDTVGIEHVHYLHLNDSKHPFGSEKDEHEHIGEGEIGEEGFRLLINHDELRALPMVVETPVDEKGFAWNIEKIKSLREDG